MSYQVTAVQTISGGDLQENGGTWLVEQGVAAIPVEGITAPDNRPVKGKAVPVYVVSDAEFNAGTFRKGHGQPITVGTITALGFKGALELKAAIPVYAVNSWP